MSDRAGHTLITRMKRGQETRRDWVGSRTVGTAGMHETEAEAEAEPMRWGCLGDRELPPMSAGGMILPMGPPSSPVQAQVQARRHPQSPTQKKENLRPRSIRRWKADGKNQRPCLYHQQQQAAWQWGFVSPHRWRDRPADYQLPCLPQST
jgi:hypothetical protein